jgi:hypothetical protein
MFKIDERVYFLKDNRIQSGFVLGWQQSVVKTKDTQLTYLIGKEISGNISASQYFHHAGNLDYIFMPPHLVFEHIGDLTRFHEQLYQKSKGIKNPEPLFPTNI